MEGWKDGKSDRGRKEKEGQHQREIKVGVDNKVGKKKSEKFIESENKERKEWGRKTERKIQGKKCK